MKKNRNNYPMGEKPQTKKKKKTPRRGAPPKGGFSVL